MHEMFVEAYSFNFNQILGELEYCSIQWHVMEGVGITDLVCLLKSSLFALFEYIRKTESTTFVKKQKETHWPLLAITKNNFAAATKVGA